MIKKILSVALVAVAAVSVNAQTWVSASVSLEKTKNDNESTSTFSKYFWMPLTIAGAYQFADNQMAGIALDYKYTKSKYEYTMNVPNLQGGGTTPTTITNEDSNNSFSVSPFYRYKLLEWNGIDIWGEAKATVGEGLYGFSLAPILQYDINDHFSFVGQWYVLGFSYTHKDVDSTASSELTFGANRNSSVSFGLMYKF